MELWGIVQQAMLDFTDKKNSIRRMPCSNDSMGRFGLTHLHLPGETLFKVNGLIQEIIPSP